MTERDEDRPRGQRVVEAVADETGRDPMALEPLYETVDPDCLEGLFQSDPSVAGRDVNRVEFWYAGCRVVVSSDGSVVVSPEEDDPPTAVCGDGPNDSSRSRGSPD